MKPIYKLFAFIVVAICSGCRVYVFADTSGGVATTVSIAGNGLTATSPGAFTRDFGIINPSVTGQLVEDEVITNDGLTDLKIIQMSPSCNCTTATVVSPDGKTAAVYHTSTPAGSQPVITVAPGLSAALHVTIDTADASAGTFVKTVTFTTEPESNPPLAISFHFEVRPTVTLIPTVANFGRVAAGSMAKISVSATFDKSLVASFTKDAPILRCSNAFVRVNAPILNTNADGTVTGTYGLTLQPNAPIGQLSGTLSFTSDQSSSETTPWNGAQALVIGQVTGAACAWPQQVAFGTVAANSDGSQTVSITGPSKVVDTLTVNQSDAWFAVKLIPAQKATTVSLDSSIVVVASRVIVISLAHGAKPGVFSGTVIVTLANDQTMIIPVSAALD